MTPPTLSRFEAERAAALRATTARSDTLRGRWAAHAAWRLDERARDHRRRATGLGGAEAVPAAEPPRPWRWQRTQAAQAQAAQAQAAIAAQHPTDAAWEGFCVAILAAISACVAVGFGVWIAPAAAVVLVGGWWLLMPRLGPIRPIVLAVIGAVALLAAAAAWWWAARGAAFWGSPWWAPTIRVGQGAWTVPVLPAPAPPWRWVLIPAWVGLGALAGAGWARSVAGWRPPVTGRRSAERPCHD